MQIITVTPSTRIKILFTVFTKIQDSVNVLLEIVIFSHKNFKATNSVNIQLELQQKLK